MIGTRLGQYRIDALLGQGGMGAVYLATDEMLGRHVAIKVLRDDVNAQGTATERFRSEAQILSRLDHPHILRLYGFSQDQGVLYMVTEFVRGEALQRRLEHGEALETTQVLEWATQLLDALDYAHQLGVVHRDIKPANILIDERHRARLLDFGIARIVGTEGLTMTGHAVGTLTYMAPEQVLDEPIDGRADLYSFAVVLCQMFTGRRPYRSTTTAGLIREIVYGPPPDVAALLPSQALVFAPALLHALARQPADRTPTAARMREELTSAAKGAWLSPAGLPPLPARANPTATVLGGLASTVTDGVTGGSHTPTVGTASPPPAAPPPADAPIAVPAARRGDAWGLIVPAVLLCAMGVTGWYVFGPQGVVKPAITPASPAAEGGTSARTPDAPVVVATAPATVPAVEPAPVAPAAPSKQPSSLPDPAARPSRSTTTRASKTSPPVAEVAPPPVVSEPTASAPVPATPLAEEAAPPPAADTPATAPATVEFNDIILMDRVDDEDEEIDASIRLDARRVVVLDEDGIPKRSIAYDAIARATYNTRRPGRFSLRRSSSHWLTIEVGTVPIVLRLNSRTYEQVLTTLQGHGVRVERNP